MGCCDALVAMTDELDALRKRITELVKECSELRIKAFIADLPMSEVEHRLKMRVSELEAVIKSHGIPVKTYSGGVAHYCTGIYDAKEEV